MGYCREQVIARGIVAESKSTKESIEELIKKLSEDIQKDIDSKELRVKSGIAKKTKALAMLIIASARTQSVDDVIKAINEKTKADGKSPLLM